MEQTPRNGKLSHATVIALKGENGRAIIRPDKKRPRLGQMISSGTRLRAFYDQSGDHHRHHPYGAAQPGGGSLLDSVILMCLRGPAGALIRRNDDRSRYWSALSEWRCWNFSYIMSLGAIDSG